MATLTPGELFGALKENNAQLLTQISAIFSSNSSPAPTGAQSSRNGVTGDQHMHDAWDHEDGEDPTRGDVLPTRGRKARRDDGGSAVTERLNNPPPLTSITPPFHKQQHHARTEEGASYTAYKGKSRWPCHS